MEFRYRRPPPHALPHLLALPPSLSLRHLPVLGGDPRHPLQQLPRSCDDGNLGQEATHGPMVGAFGKETLTQEPANEQH
uniref:Uncharacterized protein n=1 Tax=Oryza punctata TaxID=4537 RepID=A0A0E0LSK3_ORYPU